MYILALSSPSSPSISVSLCKFVPCVVTFALCSYFLGRCIKSSSASSSSSSASASSSSSSASASYRPRHPRRPHRRDEHHHHHHDRRYQHPIITLNCLHRCFRTRLIIILIIITPYSPFSSSSSLLFTVIVTAIVILKFFSFSFRLASMPQKITNHDEDLVCPMCRKTCHKYAILWVQSSLTGIWHPWSLFYIHSDLDLCCQGLSE